MEWLIGIVALVLAIRFWKISLPLIGILGLGIGGYLLYEHNLTKQQEAEFDRYIRQSKAIASSEGRVWKVESMQDPASDKTTPSSAVVQSNDGLCKLSVERRITGTELTGIYCDRLKVDDYKNIQVKFDNYDFSDAMDIRTFQGGDSVYIPSSGHHALAYKEFLRQLGTGKAVSLRLETDNAGTQWVTFTLDGSGEALDELYGSAHETQ